MSKNEALHGIEVGLAVTDENGVRTVTPGANVGAAQELRIRAEEMNLRHPEANAKAVFRHVIYEDWAPINKIERVPNPAIPYSTMLKVS